jgi:hypothetical protein
MPQGLGDRPWGSLPQRDPVLGAEGVASKTWPFPWRGRSLNWTSRGGSPLARPCGVFAGRSMRAVGNHRGARTISLALVAGLVAFEAGLVLSTGAIGIPGLLLVHLAQGNGAPQAIQGAGTQDGGETVVTKLQQVESTSEQTASIETAKNASAAPGDQELSGLADEPSWDREHSGPAEPKAFAADSGAREVLPWDAVEPVPFDSDAPPGAAKPVETPPVAAPSHPLAPPVHLRESREVEGWVKAKATEIKGEDRGKPLYHFELWLEPPEQVKQRLVAVAYDFNTPAVMPQSQVSSEQKTGFRVSVGGLACADKITVTLKFNDGQSQQVAVDGCRLLG